MIISNGPLLTAGSMGSDIASAVFNTGYVYMAAVQAVFTGSPVGTLKLQAKVEGAWDDVAGSESSVSGAGSVTWNLESFGSPFVRVYYVRTSGTGSLNVAGYGKGD